MKILKKVIAVMLSGAVVLSFVGCNARDYFAFSKAETVTEAIDKAVQMPEQYKISYEAESPDGKVYTVTKSKDSDGNIYFSSADGEMLFIKAGNLYTIYEKNKDGIFEAGSRKASCNETYIKTVTQEFTQYAEKSKDKFIPGMKKTGETETLGRTCITYETKVGTNNTAVGFSLLVDKKTGICLGFSEDKKALGQELETNGDVFKCTEFITEDVPQLRELIGETAEDAADETAEQEPEAIPVQENEEKNV